MQKELSVAHPIPHFTPIFHGIACIVAKLNTGLMPCCHSKEMKLLIIVVLQPHPCTPSPQVVDRIFLYLKILKLT